MNSLRVMGKCRNLMFGGIDDFIALDKELEVVLANISEFL